MASNHWHEFHHPPGKEFAVLVLKLQMKKIFNIADKILNITEKRDNAYMVGQIFSVLVKILSYLANIHQMCKTAKRFTVFYFTSSPKRVAEVEPVIFTLTNSPI